MTKCICNDPHSCPPRTVNLNVCKQKNQRKHGAGARASSGLDAGCDNRTSLPEEQGRRDRGADQRLLCLGTVRERPNSHTNAVLSTVKLFLTEVQADTRIEQGRKSQTRFRFLPVTEKQERDAQSKPGAPDHSTGEHA